MCRADYEMVLQTCLELEHQPGLFMLSRESFHTCLQHHFIVRSTKRGFLSATPSVTTIWLSNRMSCLRIKWWKQKLTGRQFWSLIKNRIPQKGDTCLQLHPCTKKNLQYVSIYSVNKLEAFFDNYNCDNNETDIGCHPTIYHCILRW